MGKKSYLRVGDYVKQGDSVDMKEENKRHTSLLPLNSNTTVVMTSTKQKKKNSIYFSFKF